MGNGPSKVWSFQQACPSSKHNHFWCNVRLMLHEMRHDPQWHINPTESNFFKMRNLNKNYQTKNQTKVLQRRNSSTFQFFPKFFPCWCRCAKSQGVHPINSRPGARWGIWNPNNMKNPMKNHGKTMEIIQNTMKHYEKTVIYAMKCHEILWNHGIWKSIQIVMEYAANICQCYA